MSLLDRVQRKAEGGTPPAPSPQQEPSPAPQPSPAGWQPRHVPSQSGNGSPPVQPQRAPVSAPPAPSPTTPPPVQQPAPVIPASVRAPIPAAPERPAADPGAPRTSSSLLNRTGLGRGLNRGAPGHAYSGLRAKVHTRLVDELAGNDNTPPEKVRQRIAELVGEVASEQAMTLSRQDRLRVIETVINDVLGLGPLEDLLANEDITEIMINGPRQIYVEQRGKLSLSPTTFESNEQLLQVIDRIVSSIGRRVDESSPMVDARLQDGSRVNVIIPPLALRGPTMTIRKFAKEALQIEDLIKFGSITEDMARFLRACVRSRLNVLVSGGTGSGKTTTLNVLSHFIPDGERIVTIEDAAELQLRQDHVVTLETRPANVEGRGRVSIRDLVINSLRMRPDRIVVGECRGGEALDMLQAMNTGHDGSLTTLHANNPHEAVSRLETMVLMAGADLPSRAIREQIGSAVQIIVHQSRLRDGTRKIVSVTEVLGTEGDDVKMQEIFAFKAQRVDEHGSVIGVHTPTGIMPGCMQHLTTSGEEIPESLFQPALQVAG